MKVAAITITYNRIELTKRTIESFNAKTKVDMHLFIDNGSTDGTVGLLKMHDHICLDRNYGISHAFREAFNALQGYDYIIKLDNDVETVTDNIVERMLEFYELNGKNFVCSPVDLNLDKAYSPPVFGTGNLKGFRVNYVNHTGGAFQMIPYSICKRLVIEYRHLLCGDYMIGKYFRRHGYQPTYLLDLEMRHIGLNQTSANYVL